MFDEFIIALTLEVVRHKLEEATFDVWCECAKHSNEMAIKLHATSLSTLMSYLLVPHKDKDGEYRWFRLD